MSESAPRERDASVREDVGAAIERVRPCIATGSRVRKTSRTTGSRPQPSTTMACRPHDVAGGVTASARLSVDHDSSRYSHDGPHAPRRYRAAGPALRPPSAAGTARKGDG